jgi:hypothetical protein
MALKEGMVRVAQQDDRGKLEFQRQTDQQALAAKKKLAKAKKKEDRQTLEHRRAMAEFQR